MTTTLAMVNLLAVSLPSFLTPDRLRWLIPLLTLVLIVGSFMMMRFITQLIIKASLLGVVALFVLTLWVQRSDLGDCAKTCGCSLYGIDVEITSEKYVEYGCNRN
jgi:hypothetical protein